MPTVKTDLPGTSTSDIGKKIIEIIMYVLILALVSWFFVTLIGIVKRQDEKNSSVPKQTISIDSTITLRKDSTAAPQNAVVVRRDTTIKRVKKEDILNSQSECSFCAKDRFNDSYRYFILVFAVLIALLALPRLTNLTINSTGLVLSLTQQEHNAQQSLPNNATPPPPAPGVLTAKKNVEKGRWGGLVTNNNRKISAIISRSIIDNDVLDVIVTVESTDPKRFPLTDTVAFYLPGYPNSNPVIFPMHNKAVTTFKTRTNVVVGAETDKGETRLELDLQSVAPELFV